MDTPEEERVQLLDIQRACKDVSLLLKEEAKQTC